MPQIGQKPHGRRHQGIILWEFELGGKDAAFVGSALWSFDQRFPDEEVVFGDGAGGDAVWGVLGEVFVFLEEALARY